MERTPTPHAGRAVLTELLGSLGLEGLAALTGVDAVIDRLARRADEGGVPCR